MIPRKIDLPQLRLFLDFDGTLVFNSTHSFSQLLQLAVAYGFKGSSADAEQRLRSCTTDYEIADQLGMGVDTRGFTSALLDANMLNLENSEYSASLLRVIHELGAHHELYIISNRDQLSLEVGIEKIGLSHLFKEVVGAQKGLRGKPFTEMCDGLLQRLGVGDAAKKTQIDVYIGDKGTDYQFAQKAHMKFIGACWYHDRLSAKTPNRCVKINDLRNSLKEIS